MHSRIFQISKMGIEKENYLNEDTLHQGDGSFYDYCAEIDDEERKEDIRYLVNTAPVSYTHLDVYKRQVYNNRG